MAEEISKVEQAEAIVNRYIGWSAGGAVIPFPVWDLAAVTAVQMKMISDLSALYEVPFTKTLGRASVAGLLGSLAPAAATPVAISLFKLVPVVGPIMAFASGPSFAAAATYGIGKVFTKHFEAGGTLLDFDVESMSGYFEAKYKEATKKPASKSAA